MFVRKAKIDVVEGASNSANERHKGRLITRRRKITVVQHILLSLQFTPYAHTLSLSYLHNVSISDSTERCECLFVMRAFCSLVRSSSEITNSWHVCHFGISTTIFVILDNLPMCNSLQTWLQFRADNCFQYLLFITQIRNTKKVQIFCFLFGIAHHRLLSSCPSVCVDWLIFWSSGCFLRGLRVKQAKADDLARTHMFLS